MNSLFKENPSEELKPTTPEVILIEFPKYLAIGLPIFPIKLEGNLLFSRHRSKYTWEYKKLPSTDSDQEVQAKVSAQTQMLEWKSCPGTIAKSPLHAYTPKPEFAGAILRFTCTPSNEDGNLTGIPFSVETEPLVLLKVPIKNFIFQDRVGRLIAKSGAKSAMFRFVQYNILAETRAKKELTSSKKEIPKEIIPEDFRIPVLGVELRAYDADIICLQEVESQYFEDYLRPFLVQECGLEGILASPVVQDGKEIERGGKAMFYSTDKFELLEAQVIELVEYIKSLPFYTSTTDTLKEKISENSNLFQMCVFKMKLPRMKNKLLLVANCHLWSHPYADNIRFIQTMSRVCCIESKVAELKLRFPKMVTTVIFAGDMNSPPEFSAVRFLANGEIFANNEEWATLGDGDQMVPGVEWHHSLKLTNTHPNNEFTRIVPHANSCMDYIFYQERHLKMLAHYPPPSTARMAEICNVSDEKLIFPNFQAPSDHLPLIVDFQFRELDFKCCCHIS